MLFRSLVGHQPTHIFLEKRLSPHHQMREHSLIGSIIPEMLVTRCFVCNIIKRDLLNTVANTVPKVIPLR